MHRHSRWRQSLHGSINYVVMLGIAALLLQAWAPGPSRPSLKRQQQLQHKMRRQCQMGQQQQAILQAQEWGLAFEAASLPSWHIALSLSMARPNVYQYCIVLVARLQHE
jgi:hypothetical protein